MSGREGVGEGGSGWVGQASYLGFLGAAEFSEGLDFVDDAVGAAA